MTWPRSRRSGRHTSGQTTVEWLAAAAVLLVVALITLALLLAASRRLEPNYKCQLRRTAGQACAAGASPARVRTLTIAPAGSGGTRAAMVLTQSVPMDRAFEAAKA